MNQMKTEKQKSLKGDLYSACDPKLVEERKICRLLLQKYNNTGPDELNLRKGILQDLMGGTGKELEIDPPFYCDYGSNIILGNEVYFNTNYQNNWSGLYKEEEPLPDGAYYYVVEYDDPDTGERTSRGGYIMLHR